MQRRIWILAALLLQACASVPTFYPSRPIASARNLQEGLILCNEYRMPVPAERPIALKPYLNCLDDVAELPSAHGTPAARAFQSFKDEFHHQYGLLEDSFWTPRLGAEMEVAIHAMLRALWQGKANEASRYTIPNYTLMEKKLALRFFPRSAHLVRADSWTATSRAALDPALESLRAGLSSLENTRGEWDPSVIPEGSLNALGDLCRRLNHLRSEVDYLGELRQDELDIAEAAPDSPAIERVERRYRDRLQSSARELEDLRPRIQEAQGAGGFRAAACGNAS